MFSSVTLPLRSVIESKRPVIFFANGLGDAILALPALRALTSLFPYLVTLVCDDALDPVLFRELPLRELVETRMKRNVPDWTREFSVTEVTDEVGECDLFISLVPWYSDSLRELLRRLHPGISVGFFDDFKITVPLDFQKHAADLAFDISRQFNNSLRFDDYASPPNLPAESQRRVQRIMASLPPSTRTMVVHADTGSNKMWPLDRFLDVLDCFLNRHRDFLVFLVGASPQPLDRGQNAEQVIPAYGLPLEVSLGLVGQADLFLGVDSSMLHAADFYRVPSVGLFGASSPLQFGFRLSSGSIVCRGKSMESIDVDHVLDALEAVLIMRKMKEGK